MRDPQRALCPTKAIPGSRMPRVAGIILSLALMGLGGCGASFGSDVAAASTASPIDPTLLTQVEIRRDSDGTPHIRAGTDEGAMYGLGWTTADDRLAQINIAARVIQGRMAEVFGPEFVDQDVSQRLQGSWRYAQQVTESLPKETKTLLQAYADGVNARIGEGDLPAYMEGIGLVPEAWTPAHSVAVFWRYGSLFGPNVMGKAGMLHEFEDLVAELGQEAAIEAMSPTHPGNPEAGVVQDDDVADELQAEIMEYAASLGFGGDDARRSTHPGFHPHESPKFSHVWAVSGANTNTGEAVLVSDPQIPVHEPNALYEFSIQGETLHARGVGFPGTAGLLIGFTPTVAWGLTAAGLDQADLFRLDMVDDDSYRIDGVEYDLLVEEEFVQVSGADPIRVTYRQSLWGPLVTELTAASEGEEFALHAPQFVEPGRDTVEALIGMMRADDMDAFRTAIEDFRFPSANLVAADGDGNIFYTILGALPVRSQRSPLGGMIAQDGGSRANAWQDTIPGIYKPWVLNPSEGYVFSANHRIAGSWYPLPLGVGVGTLGDSSRSVILRELLSDLPTPATATDVLNEVQFSCVNPFRRDLVRAAERFGRGLSPAARNALRLLSPWAEAGGNSEVGEPMAFLASQMSLMFRNNTAGPVLMESFGGGAGGLALFLETMLNREIVLIPEVQQAAVAYLDEVLSDALEAANAHPRDAWIAAHAADQGTWQGSWLTGFDGLASLDSDADMTVRVRCGENGSIWSQRGQTYTQWVKLGAINRSGSMLAMGNNEDPSEPSFDSQLDLWVDGELKPAPLSRSAIRRITRVQTTLRYDPH